MQMMVCSDFSGGISEQYAIEGFDENQWAKLKGFVVDSDYSIRSQWAAQSVGAAGAITPGVKSVTGFVGSSATYLVALATDGTVWTATAPSDTANYTVANAVTWTKQTSITSNTDYRFITDIRMVIKPVGEVNCVLLLSVSGTNDAYAIYENDLTSTLAIKTWDRHQPVDQPNLTTPEFGEVMSTTTAVSYTATTSWTEVSAYTDTVETDRWTIANDGDYPVQVRINSGATLQTVQPYDSWTAEANLYLGEAIQVQAVGGSSVIRIGKLLASYPRAMRNVMPRANCGVMWREHLILGDTLTRRDTTKPWTATDNIQRAAYNFWYSDGTVPDSFHEQGLFYAGSGESQIIGMHVLDDYLITVSSVAADTDGVRMFRGSLSYIEMQEGTASMAINVVRGGIGPARDTGTNGNRHASCVWGDAGLVVLLDRLGGVWYTDGQELGRLDETGPEMPDYTSPTDEIAALGKYLFVKRAGRLLVLNLLRGVRGVSGTGAWTELVLPAGATYSSFCAVNGSMYFVMNNRVYRYCVSRNSTSDSERASYDNTKVDLTVATRTMEDTDKHRRLEWFQVGLRTRGLQAGAVVNSVKINAGPALDSTVKSHTWHLGRALDGRDELVLPSGIGTSVECSLEAVFQGDLKLESVSFWTSGSKPSRPAAGSDV